MSRASFLALAVLFLARDVYGLAQEYFEPAPAAGVFFARIARGTLVIRGNQVSLHSGSQSLRMGFRGAASKIIWHPQGPSIGHSTYLMGGENPRVAEHYNEIQAEVYPGITARLHFEPTGLEYDFILAPGADPSRIRLVAARPAHVRVESSGDLIVETSALAMRHKSPRAYQERREIPVQFQRRGHAETGFQVNGYDRTKTLIIDPALLFSNAFGGSSYDGPSCIAVDTVGNLYVAGITQSSDFPRTAMLPSTAPAPFTQTHVFVTKLDPTGRQVLYSVYFGGNTTEAPGGIAVDAQGSVYVAGITQSTDFPTTPGAYGTSNTNVSNFVVKLDPQGTRFLYSTFLGRAFPNLGPMGIATDTAGDAYVVGTAAYSDFPVTPGSWLTLTSQGQAFLAKLNPQGSKLVFGTFLPLSPTALTLAKDGSIYVAGGGSSAFLSATPPFPNFSNAFNGAGAAVVGINAAGTAPTFGAVMGGSGGDSFSSIALDSSGMVYVGGLANSGSPADASHPFPTTPGAASQTFQNNIGFVAKMDPAAGKLIYSTYLVAENSSNYSQGVKTVHSAADGTVWALADAHFSRSLGGSTPRTAEWGGSRLFQFAADGSAIVSSLALPLSSPVGAWDDQHL